VTNAFPEFATLPYDTGARAAVAHSKRVDELTHAFAAKPVVGQQRTA